MTENNTIKSPRGSEWRKWDLHVHTPESVLSNNFGNDWDEYVKKLFKKAIAENIKAIGITDYFTIDGYKKLKEDYLLKEDKLIELFSSDEIEIIKTILVLPNIEFRLNKLVGQNRINYHVLFSEDLSINDIEENFLHDIEFVFEGIPFGANENRKLKKNNLQALGQKLQNEHPNFRAQTPLFTGMMNAVVDDAQISNILDSQPSIFQGKYLLAIPCDEDLSKVSWNSQDHQARKVLIQKSSLLIASNPKTIAWGLGAGEIEEYVKEFKSIKPCIFGSDAHSYEEMFTKNKDKHTWIKSELTFAGLKQIINEPTRVFIGDTPEILKRVSTNPTKYIKSLKINKTENSSIPDIWFDKLEVEFNPELVAIIGNKGKGKSALADILGLCANAHINEDDFSFLHKDKFRNPRPNYAKNYEAVLTWEGGFPENRNLASTIKIEAPERVKYLPQNFLERLCTSIDKKVFEEELEKVIFSRLEDHQKLEKGTLKELLNERKQSLENQISQLKSEISQKNISIVELERKDSLMYRNSINEALLAKQNELRVHHDKEPQKKIPPQENAEKQAKTQETIKQIEALRAEIKVQESQKEIFNKRRGTLEFEINELTLLDNNLQALAVYIKTVIANNSAIIEKHKLNSQEIIKYSEDFIDRSSIIELIRQKQKELVDIQNTFSNTNQTNPDLIIIKANNSIKELQDALEGESREYQLYLSQVLEWDKLKNDIIGSPEKDGTLKYYEAVKNYLDTQIKSDISAEYIVRKEILYQILKLKKSIANLYSELYKPVTDFIAVNRNQLSDYNVNVDVALELDGFENKFFNYISNGNAGSFYGANESRLMLTKISETVDFNEIEAVSSWIEVIINHLQFDKRTEQSNEVRKELKSQLKGGFTEKDFYDFLFSMDYYSPNYQLKLGTKKMLELSPGERGALLLIFYLLLDKRDIPIIIDQPEENLDNQSVYNILVHFIKKAKANRQIIIVTHNPNLAVVCDAEQIIRMDIIKENGNEVKLITGGIENSEINKAIVDILEGTKPAFNNRTGKYRLSNNI